MKEKSLEWIVLMTFIAFWICTLLFVIYAECSSKFLLACAYSHLILDGVVIYYTFKEFLKK